MTDMSSLILDASGQPMRRSAGYGHDTSHDAASFQGQFKDWAPGNGSADADLLPEVEDIISRSRDAGRNQVAAVANVSTLVYGVVGAGLTVVPQPNYRALGKTKEWADEWTRTVQAKAQDYFGSTDVDAAGIDDFASLTSQVFQSTLMNGGVMALPIWRARVAPQRMTRYRTAFQLVEIDRLSNPNNSMDEEFLRGGVQIDEYGEPVLYNVLKNHPGDTYMGIVPEWEQIPAYTEWGRARALHVFSRDRVDAHRGTPLLAPVIPGYKHLDDYQKHELNAAAANAVLAMTVESELPGEIIKDLFGDYETYLTQRAAHKAKFKSGTIMGLFPGDKISGFAPARPNANYGPFVESIMRPAAAATGMPLELVMRNFTTMNYSSMRGMMIEAKRTFMTMRSWLTRRWCNPAYQLWFEEAVENDEIPDCTFEELYGNWGAWTRCRWLGTGAGWVDPTKEIDASHSRVAYGIASLEEECADQGKDWRDVADQQATERKYYAGLGLQYPGDASIGKPVAAPPGQQPPHPDDDFRRQEPSNG